MSCVGILRGATRDIEDLMIPIILWDTLTVGRNENCHFVIDFPFIDQLQCEFTARTQEFDNIVYLTDRSRNGTFCNLISFSVF
ncbi:hypothetical protein BCV71DRAFT_90453 [Rhizopus microsporus]|uniref:FHA domain-containing protein n=1 Tax=Rhizopus microsporus TaxID=58291 RepID=A0A1X0S7D2_RHIZD|nr:hypothetical protein BCV71DRAFT_90453 [Rhizopus microsporus]